MLYYYVYYDIVMNLESIATAQNPWWEDPGIPPTGITFRRNLQAKVRDRLGDSTNRRATVLRGPRQVGKTTMMLQCIQDLLAAGWPPRNILYFSFDDDRIIGEPRLDEVEQLRPESTDSSTPRILLMDEVGRAAKWDLWLKRKVDEGEDLILATDSSSTLLQGGSAESGQGRWDEVILEGLLFSEFVSINAGEEPPAVEAAARQPRLLERYLRIGGFPEHALAEDPGDVTRRIREDIAGRAIEGDLARQGGEVKGPKDLFVYVVQNSGLLFNASGIAKDALDRDPRSVRDWILKLENTLLLSRLDRYSRSPSSSHKAYPKYYASDHGIVGAFATGSFDQGALRGRVIESAVYRHLRHVAAESEGELSFFSNKRQEECDFLLNHSGKTVAIEVAASREARSDKIGRLATIVDREGFEAGMLIYTGYEAREQNGISVVPLSRFLLHPEVAVVTP